MFLNIKWSRLVKTIQKRDILVRFLNGLNHLKTNLQNVRILNEPGFRMVGFRIPTVMLFLCSLGGYQVYANISISDAELLNSQQLTRPACVRLKGV